MRIKFWTAEEGRENREKKIGKGRGGSEIKDPVVDDELYHLSCILGYSSCSRPIPFVSW